MGDQTPIDSGTNVSTIDSENQTETLVWTAGPTDVNLPVRVHSEHQQDFHSFRHQSQPHQPYPDYLVYPQYQQFALLNSSVTGAESNGQSPSTSWYITEPILYSMMPGEVHPSEANVCVPFTMDKQHFREGSADNNHLTHLMLHNGNQSGQVVLTNPEPEPVFTTLENALLDGNDSICHKEVVTTHPHDPVYGPELELVHGPQNASSNCTDAIVMDSHSQVACPPVSTEQTASRNHKESASQTVSNSRELRSFKPCHCAKSKCLKLYCECFSNGVMCKNCNCTNCHNNPEHEAKRGKAMKSYLARNPNAFRSKKSCGKSGDVKGWHCRGCNCKRSGCLKNYCECYEANIRCTPSCKCVGCRNYNVNLMERSFSEKYRAPTSVISSAVVETITACLLARSAETEREQRSKAGAEREVLIEFGQCLSQIVQAMFEKYT